MNALRGLRHAAEAVAAALMAAMFLTFILQIAVRYTARIPAMKEAVPLLEPSLYGWTLELCLALWVWIVFFGCAFVVRREDHVTFDLLYLAVPIGVRRVFLIVGGLAIAAGLLLSIEPTWGKFAILRLKRTATLGDLFGDQIRMRHIYAIYIVFLAAVGLRYLWAVWSALRHGVPEETPAEGSAAIAHATRRLDE